MAEPAEYRHHGPGDDTRRHSSHKRTRGEEEDYVKYARRRYDGDDEKSISDRRDDGSKRRSLSPRDGVQREKSHRNRHDAYRRDERRRDFGHDHASQSKRQEQQSNPITGSKSRSDRRSLARSPSPSSTRHHHSHSHSHSRHHQHHHHHHRRHRSSAHPTDTPDELPFGSRPLQRSDLENFRPLLAQYLEVQKQKDMAALDEREVKGRWKSFVGKWNHGELAEGWYHPETLVEARRNGLGAAPAGGEHDASSSSRLPPTVPTDRKGREGSDGGSSSAMRPKNEEEQEDDSDDSGDDDDDDGYGPILPPGDSSSAATTRSARRGPGIPSLQDLALRREAIDEERMNSIDQLRLARKADRVEQRERLADLAPRADAGTRERRLEKRREVNDKLRGFRERSPGGAVEVGEAELMGGGGGSGGVDDSVAEYKRVQEAARRKRSEREVRREEEARAKAAEREVRMEEYRRREESTMQVLRQIARERFG